MAASYHDHGNWQGPCADARHDLIRAGGKASDNRTARDSALYVLKWTVRAQDGLRCACCKELLIADPQRLADIEQDAMEGK